MAKKERVSAVRYEEDDEERVGYIEVDDLRRMFFQSFVDSVRLLRKWSYPQGALIEHLHTVYREKLHHDC